MSKCEKLVKLSEVSEKFTTDTLKEIFSAVYGCKNVQITNWSLGGAGVKGDNYLSTVHRMEAEAIVDGKPQSVKLFIKSLPKNIGRRKTFRSAEFFSNEIHFYTKIVPKFEKFLAEKGHSELLSIPRCLAAHTDGENDYLALEDVSPLGFDRVSRETCIDIDQAKIILIALARFHSISFALKDQAAEEFNDIQKSLRDTYYRPDLWNWYKKFHAILLRVAKDALVKEYPGSLAEKRFLSYEYGQLFDKCVEFCSRTDSPSSVVTQGDSWPPNFLIRQLADDTTEALMLDFQLAHCTSPVLDIAFFIYTSTDKSLRDNYFDHMLEIYYDELRKTVTSLGSDLEKLYPWTTFMSEVKEQFVYGITFALEAVPFCLLSESQSFDLDLITNEKGIDISEIWNLPNIESKEGRRRLTDIIAHAAEKGFL